MSYKPPFEITDTILNLITEIMENLGMLKNTNNFEKLPRLRKISRIRSIHSSLAIEQNTLSIGDVTDVVDGKRVIGEKKEILEVKNANEAYKLITNVNPYSIDDLLKVHSIMMNDLVIEAGKFRTKSVGVLDEFENVVHIAPPANMVYENMKNLFEWLEDSNINFLVKSCVFHYEFEFIHPFNDGNGRMGRLWQTVILSSYRPIFEWIPIESIIKDNQEEYYKVLNVCDNSASSTKFIEFMLDCINKAVKDILDSSKLHLSHISSQITSLLSVMDTYPLTSSEMMAKLGLSSREGFRRNYLKPALDCGVIKMTNPDKPKSKNQRYYKT